MIPSQVELHHIFVKLYAQAVNGYFKNVIRGEIFSRVYFRNIFIENFIKRVLNIGLYI